MVACLSLVGTGATRRACPLTAGSLERYLYIEALSSPLLALHCLTYQMSLTNTSVAEISEMC